MGEGRLGLPGRVWELRHLPSCPSFPRENRSSNNFWENVWKSQTAFCQTSATSPFSTPALFASILTEIEIVAKVHSSRGPTASAVSSRKLSCRSRSRSSKAEASKAQGRARCVWQHLFRMKLGKAGTETEGASEQGPLAS